MTEALTIARFQELADAYGGVVARWPDRHRDAGMRLAATPAGAVILAEAVALDERLDLWRVEAPAPNLAARIIANGAIRTGGSMTAGGLARRRWWWSGAGFAAMLAGAVAGTAAVAMSVPFDIATMGAGIAVTGSTSFGEVSGPEG